MRPERADGMPWEDAVELLRKRAQTGLLTARGRPSEGGKPKVVRAVEWDDLFPFEIKKRPVLRFEHYGFPNLGYDHVHFPRAQVVRLFSAPTPAVRRAETTRQAQSACQKWLEGLMRASLKVKPKARAELMHEALADFDGLSKRAFGLAWSAAVVVTGATVWSMAGRPAKSFRRKPIG
jgi:hypothetical protein